MKESEKIHVLFVDDDKINILFYSEVFKEYFQVSVAESGSAGLEVLKANPSFEVIVSDMKMPGISGMDFIEAASKLYKNKKFIILTGYSMDQRMAKALKTGLVVEFFQKPFIEEAIVAAIYKIAKRNAENSSNPNS
jgi:CheY-like chemotaxis protein